MSYLITVIVITLITFSTSAQMATASLFRSMKSENPAVISGRPAATLALSFKKDSIEKTQDVTSPLTSSKSEIEISNTNFFYGGQGGGPFTTEISGEVGSGEKKDTVITAGFSDETKSETDMTMINAAVGFSDFIGIGLTRVSNKNTQTGTTSSSSEFGLNIYNIGLKFNMGLDFGLLYQHAPLEDANGGSTNMSRIGIGTGIKSKSFHFEVAYIKNLKEEIEELGGGSGPGSNTLTHNPAKAMLTLEFKLGSLSLGVTSNYYMEGFFDFNNLIYYTMVMSSNKENRLENTFNFSFGGEKGHSFSGGITIASVESTEAPPTLLSGAKYNTTTDIFGVQLSYSYAF